MTNKTNAAKVLPDYLSMIDGDLMKITHYLEESVKVAVIADKKHMAELLALCFVKAEDLQKELKTVISITSGEKQD